MPTVERANARDLDLEQLQVIETGWGPTVESALLVDLVKRSLRSDQSLADPTEIPNEGSPLARMNAYKHRVHSLRCAYAQARLRGIELEEQLAEAQLQNHRLQGQIQPLQAEIHHLQATLEQIYATRTWKIRERWVSCRETVLGWLRFRSAVLPKRSQRSS